MMARGENKNGIWAGGLQQEHRIRPLSAHVQCELLSRELEECGHLATEDPHSFAELYSSTDSGTLDTMQPTLPSFIRL